MVEQEAHTSRNVVGHSGGSDAVVHRRVGVGLGSPFGWGAHSDTFQASGEWSAREAILHINQLEMLAVRNALVAFKTQLSGLTVQLMSDSATVASYIAKQGGTTSVPMYLLAKEVAGHSGGSDAVVHRRVGVGLGSPFGWGAHSDTFQASGEWSAREAILHINQLEMLAVRNALVAFKTQLSGLTVQLMSDSATVASYIAKQGGTTSVPMYLLAKEVLLAARDENIFLRAKHILGERNALADLLSRMNRVVHTEWTLLQSVVDALSITWDTPNVDLLATRLNNRFAVFVSPMADPLEVEVDAMSITWKGMYAYAFPPFVMLGRIIEKLHRDHPCEMILIAPEWPNQSWYARLIELLVDFPLVLPLRKDLLTQPFNHLRHQSLQAVRLHAWRLYSDPSK